MMRGISLLLFLYITWGVSAAYADAATCGTLSNHYGPYDYTNAEDFHDKLPIVERAHFTPNVESLVSGQTGKIHQDLNYTLRTFPNHHRALYAMAQFQLRNDRPPNAEYLTADCYFDRAMRFRPQDGVVRLLYGIYLHRKGQLKDALERYKEAEQLQPDSVEVLYNLGLLYVDTKDYKSAVEYAKRAYAKGYPLPGLRNKLKRQGIWVEENKEKTKDSNG